MRGFDYPVQLLWSNCRGECYAGSNSSSSAQSRFIVEGYQGAPVTGTPQSAVCPLGTYASTIGFYTDKSNSSIAGVALGCSDGGTQEVYFSGAAFLFYYSNANGSGFNKVIAADGPSCVDALILEVDGTNVAVGGTNDTIFGTPTCGSDVIVGFTNMAADAKNSQCMASFDIICDSVPNAVNTGAASTGHSSVKSSAGLHAHLASTSVMKPSIDLTEDSARELTKKTNLRSKV